MAAAAAGLDDYGSDAPLARTKGETIRARIAANRAKRLAITEAMKREAGVTQHDVHAEDFGGLAYIGTGRIWSPEGRTMVQLYTVAHECGHIFLHNSGAGFLLPSHVQEMEAETYAHQAFREHGMELPRRLSDWGRRYVGSWVEKDRARGIPIDPRAEAYARGRRSPYEPLRRVPATWRLHQAEPVFLLPRSSASTASSRTAGPLGRLASALWNGLRRTIDAACAAPGRWWRRQRDALIYRAVHLRNRAAVWLAHSPGARRIASAGGAVVAVVGPPARALATEVRETLETAKNGFVFGCIAAIVARVALWMASSDLADLLKVPGEGQDWDNLTYFGASGACGAVLALLWRSFSR